MTVINSLTHSLTAALDQLRVVASSTSNDPDDDDDDDDDGVDDDEMHMREYTSIRYKARHTSY